MPEDKQPVPATPAVKRRNEPVKYEVYRVGQGVLQVVRNADGGTVVEATNDVVAIKTMLGDQPQPGQYVGIPLRSLRVREVGTETSVKVVIK